MRSSTLRTAAALTILLALTPGCGAADGQPPPAHAHEAAGTAGAGGSTAAAVPSCLDGEPDGEEEGVDCGSACPEACGKQRVAREQLPRTSDSTGEIPDLYDPLTDDTPAAGELEKQVNGGMFTAAGWQATDASSQIVIRLVEPLRNPGSLELDVANFDPKGQSTEAKHEIVNPYTQANGSKEIFESDRAWWNARTGQNYEADPMGIKFLSSVQGIESREETRLPTPVAWDRTQIHTFRVAWDESEIRIRLDGARLVTHPWSAMPEPFEYVFIGTNNVYGAQVGPVYSNLRVSRRADPG